MRRVLGCALLVVTTALLASGSAAADSHYAYWREAGPTTTVLQHNGACSVYAVGGALEHGSSGVVRHRIEWQRRGPHAEGWMPAYQYIGWWAGPSFPDDARSFWTRFVLPYEYMNFPTGGRYALWAKFVGERPSFWKPDVVLRIKFGEMGCSPVQVVPGT